MERYTAFLEAYSWITLSALFLGGVVALGTTSAEKRRYPVLFRRKRALLLPLLLTLSILASVVAIFLPGPENFPELLPFAFYFIPLAALATLLFRHPRTLLPLLGLLIAALVWLETEATAAYAFPKPGEPFLFVDLRQVDQSSLDLYVEIPAAGSPMLAPEGSRTFAFRAEGTTLSVTGEIIEHHPYLWWRPRWGVRIDSIGGNPGILEGEVATTDEWYARYLALLQGVGAVRRGEWSVQMSEEELLLGRYTALLARGEVTLERRRPDGRSTGGVNPFPPPNRTAEALPEK